MALETKDIEQIRMMCKLEIHEYFDTYLNDVFPKQVGQIMDAHNSDCNAHGGTLKSAMKTKWMLMGAATAAGAGGGAGILKLLELAGT